MCILGKNESLTLIEEIFKMNQRVDNGNVKAGKKSHKVQMIKPSRLINKMYNIVSYTIATKTEFKPNPVYCCKNLATTISSLEFQLCSWFNFKRLFHHSCLLSSISTVLNYKKNICASGKLGICHGQSRDKCANPMACHKSQNLLWPLWQNLMTK